MVENLAAAADNSSSDECLGDHFSQLVSLAHERGFTVKNVIGDGNCLFHSVQLQLETIGVQLDHTAIRKQLVDYLEDYPYRQNGSTHLREYLDDHVAEAEEDHFISSVGDKDTRQQLRWCKYLTRLRSTAWGHHIAVQGLANMLYVDIHIIATSNTDTPPVKSRHPALQFCTLV